jgi:hypothetical protein
LLWISGVTSVSAPNNTFSATYRNYLINLNIEGTSATTARLRLRASGTDNTGANWYWGAVRASYTNGSYAGYSGNGINYYEITDLANSAVSTYDATITIYRPFVTGIVTNIASQARGTSNGAHFASGTNDNALSFDSFSIFAAAGNIAGTLQIYGFNQ